MCPQNSASENEKDLAEIPDNVKKNLTLIPVATVEDVLKNALTAPLVAIEWREEDQKPAKTGKPGEDDAAILTH